MIYLAISDTVKRRISTNCLDPQRSLSPGAGVCVRPGLILSNHFEVVTFLRPMR